MSTAPVEVPLAQVASVHEATVQKVARGEVAPVRRRRAPSSKRRLVAAEWEVKGWRQQLRPEVAAMVDELYPDGVQLSQVQVVSEHEVIIWNLDAPWSA